MNIAVICAPQTFGCNTGMFSVDLAAWYFFQKNFPRATVRFFILYPHRCELGNAPFVYESREDFYEWESRCDRIVYWGDFLHGLAYQGAVAKWLLKTEPVLNELQVREIIRQFLFRSHSDAVALKKVVLYGGTILFNGWDSYADHGYRGDLCRLVNGAGSVWMRESFSAGMVQYWRQDYQNNAQGTDCALLLNSAILSRFVPDKRPAVAAHKKQVGVFMGRSHFQTEQATALLEQLEQNDHGLCVWLNWGGAPFFFDKQQSYARLMPGLVSPASSCDPLAALSDLMDCDVLVSDVYHVCVNAWNSGIPAICLIDDSTPLSVNRGAVTGRDKRIVFYWSYALSEFLVYASELGTEEQINQRVALLSQSLGDAASLALAFDALKQHAGACEKQLVSAITIDDSEPS